ncbi:FkbM family methyltransferase [Sphingomonas sp.]|jgi:FkbM family methyltransferase|uniref:FkbM family methyltransferase n=1 Tax=Sphingomonas sp. TaxID=28214 RepID=UPI002D7ED783|nr:FkbM family methyltransferase [Sphingomonas sp.]HEU0043302.1 FkbM family methyltransferase [Sphingomonas sp.]
MWRKAVQAALRQRGYVLRREPELSAFLRSRAVDLVVDVGGNVGQFASELRHLGYRERIWSFEPVQAIHAQLARTAATDARWRTTRTALGAQPGTASINVSDLDVFSSLRSATPTAVAFDPRSAALRTEEVPIATLDSFMADDPARAPFIKIDTQGFEREVLEGAGQTLARAVGLLIELPIADLYEGAWRFPEAIDTLDRLGFVPAQFRANTPDHDGVSALEFDCIFRRK